MPAVKARRSRNPAWFLILVVIAGVVVLAGAAAMVYVSSGGSITVPFTDPPQVLAYKPKESPRAWSPPEGKIAVPVSARAIPAYTKLTRDDVWNPKLGRVEMVYLDKSQVTDAMITELGKILGRVLDHDKAQGYVFTESDFLPAGTRPGLVAGIPPGMRAMRVELSKVRGLFGLQPGDRFDVVSTLVVTSDPTGDLKRMGGAYADRLAMEASLAAPTKQASVRVIVQNGIVVTPVQTVQVPIGAASLTGPQGKSKPVQEVVVALAPAEVSALAEAMAVDAELSVIPRSGRPDDPTDSITPDRLPRNPFTASADGQTPSQVRFVETIDGTKREIVPVPSSDETKDGAPRAK